MAPNPAELAEDVMAHLLPRPFSETIVRDGFVYSAGPQNAWVHRVRVVDVEWARAASRERGLPENEWWVGWSAPEGVEAELLAAGLVPSPTQPLLWGMTCDSSSSMPPADGVVVERVRTSAEYLEAVAVDWAVWGIDGSDRQAGEVARFDANEESGVVHHVSAFVDGRRVGFARALDMREGVALFGGTVLPEARGRGVYRALVRARWEHAAARGTPLLVVQAGQMSAPVLRGLGFETHGEVHVYVDRL